MTVSREAATRAIALAVATHSPETTGPRRDRSDFGSPDSHLLKVRRIGRDYPFGDDVRDGDFGIYLGLHQGAYVVALQAIFPGQIIGCERFASLEELRRIWELD
jgi:hypothetical protein